MKFKAERNEFADAVSWARRTVGDRMVLPAASGIRMEVSDDRLRLSSTNGEVDSELTIPVQAEASGTALVPGRVIDDVLRTLPDEPVAVHAESDQLHVSCGRAEFSLRLIDLADFPVLMSPGDAQQAMGSFKAEVFSQLVAQVARAASVEDVQPGFTGVKLEVADGQLTAAATDRYRLAVRTLPWGQAEGASALVPRRALEEARRSAEQLGSEVRLSFEPGRLLFDFGDRWLATRLVEGNFPAFRQLVPQGFERRLVVDRAEFTDVVRRVAVMSEPKAASPVVLELTSDTVKVSIRPGEMGEAHDSLPGELEGSDLTIGFNPRFLLDGLDAVGGERVVLEFRDELKPAVLRAGEQPEGEDGSGDFLYLLMPMQL
jgi:DNA polymerase III subunit beta